MGKNMNLLYVITIMSLHLFCLQNHLVVASECHEDEAAALLEFKNSLVIDQTCIENPYPGYIDRELPLWKLERNCCTWGGVKCDLQNGHVISLDLSESCLSGSINSTSSLFRLLHLQMLNLAYNHFGFSKIPTAIGNFSSLTSLDLSGCSFSGSVPSQLLDLTNLTSLNLPLNSGLKLNLENLGRSLTKLEVLDLSYVNISSHVPNVIANLSSLKFLTMSVCGLQGELPSTIFKLPKLQVLDFSSNPDLSGRLLEFESSIPLKHLSLSGTNFSGELPNSIGNVGSLIDLDLSFCHFKGFMPSSIGNLTKLTTLSLPENQLHGLFQSSFGNLTRLTYLDLSLNQLTGQIPSSFGNLINLEHLYLGSNQLSGQIPSSLGKFINLEHLKLEHNQLSGQIPPQILNLTHLTIIHLTSNNLCGTLQLDMFLGLKNLIGLFLSHNNLSVIAKTNATSSHFVKLDFLELASCKLREFPISQNLEKLYHLDLSDNDIHGEIPMSVLSNENLSYLNLSHNFLTSFSKGPIILKNIQILDLSFNELHGSPPLPSDKIVNYVVSNNRLSGDISPLMCNTPDIQVLDLSNNNFTGTIPQCISNFSSSIQILSLNGNSFSGRIPEMLEGRCDLQMVDLSNNQLDGSLPRSLSRCTKLEFLSLGNNMISDTFPSWLGSIDALMVLILRSNKFHGVIKEPKFGSEFPGLHIIDLSHNYFNGHLPSKYFQSWSSTSRPWGYLVLPEALYGDDMNQPYFYYTMMLTNKGIKMEYLKILDNFKVIDLSSNNFSGPIPTSITDVKGLHLLNLSNNYLIGQIPPSLGGLTDLQALDLSKNSLSGDIPQQLEQLTFLAFFNVSCNHLSGSIPRGKQFSTFGNDSYEGNGGLCGDPLSMKCGSSLEPPPSEEDEEMPFYIEWKAVVVGYIITFTIAALIGYHTITVRPNSCSSVRTSQLGEGRRRRQR